MKPLSFFTMYLGSHLLQTVTCVYLGQRQIDEIVRHQEILKNNGSSETTSFIQELRQRLIHMEERSKAHMWDRSEYDRKISQIEQLSNEEILEQSLIRYRSRHSMNDAGFMSWMVFFCLANVYAKLPTPMFIPMYPLLPLFFVLEFRHYQYDFGELCMSQTWTLLIPLLFWSMSRGKFLPIRANATKTKPMETKKIQGSKISQAEIDSMMKRNQKFREKNKGKT